MASVYEETASLLAEKAKQHDTALVAFSGGKDSLAVMQLCCRSFRRVVGYFLYFVPGMRFVEQQLQAARERFQVEIRQYPHPHFFQCLKEGVYCFPTRQFDKVADLRAFDFAKLAMQDTGATLITAGMRKSDGLWRKHILVSNLRKYPFLINPIQNWTKWEVLAYLASNGIPIPESSSKDSMGIDNSRQFIIWLHRNHPEDFERYCRWFPFARAQVLREELYGQSQAG